MGKQKNNGSHELPASHKKIKTENCLANPENEASVEDEAQSASPADHRLSQARILCARATCPQHLVQVKLMLESILDDSDNKDSEEWMDAGLFLATLLLQEDDDNDPQVSRLLSERGYRYRLSRQALTQSHACSSLISREYACAFDNVLPQPLLDALLQTFSPTSSFWSFHNYSDGSSQGKPPSPYFSYVIPLNETSSSNKKTVLMQILRILHALLQKNFSFLSTAKFAEWWCHCRPHSSGHQLHFDSDDEGRGGVRNPLCSSVLTLSRNVGGETLITTQTASDTTLCQESGWTCGNDAVNRLLGFKGNLLHGVVPGAGYCSSSQKDRRITFMVAFWESIHIQHTGTKKGPGAAQPWSRVEKEDWAKPLVQECNEDYTTSTASIEAAMDCFYKVPVWQDVNREENERNMVSLEQVRERKELPPYDDFFQFYT